MNTETKVGDKFTTSAGIGITVKEVKSAWIGYTFDKSPNGSITWCETPIWNNTIKHWTKHA